MSESNREIEKVLGRKSDSSGDRWGEVTRAFVKSIPQDLRALSELDLDNLERAAQGFAASIRREQLRRDGWRQVRWRRGGPQPELIGRIYFDHGYTLVGPQQQQRWVGEPYDLDEGALATLLSFAKDGWLISIRADLATHFPGHTLFVQLWRRAGEAAEGDARHDEPH